MYQYILDRTLSNRPLVRQLFEKARRVALAHRDPIVKYELSGMTIALPLSHQLPAYRREFPTYSANLSRLANFIREESGRLTMIDVGANVGDSYCLAGRASGDRYLLVEPDPRYFSLLTRNTANGSGVTLVRTLLADTDTPLAGVIESADGTARLTIRKDAAATPCTTIDALLRAQPAYQSSNLLKTDVDGYDARVLRGARDFLAQQKPVLFFEHYPSLLEYAGDDTVSIFADLAALGYTRFLLYDNVGFPIITLQAADRSALYDLMAYARSKNSYYDVCAFNDQYSESRDRFIDMERVLFSGS